MRTDSWTFDLQLDENEAIKDLHLEDNGRVQKVVDSSFIHYLRLKEPLDNGIMIAKTYSPEPGLVVVDTPYAHYLNEGVLYVNPQYGRSGFPLYKDGVKIGFKGYKGKRVPTTTMLKYHGGPGRGAFFVQRTILENQNDIINEATKEMNR